MPRRKVTKSQRVNSGIARQPAAKATSQRIAATRGAAATTARKTSKTSSGCESEWASSAQPITKTRSKAAIKATRR